MEVRPYSYSGVVDILDSSWVSFGGLILENKGVRVV